MQRLKKVTENPRAPVTVYDLRSVWWLFISGLECNSCSYQKINVCYSALEALKVYFFIKPFWSKGKVLAVKLPYN